MSPFDDVLFLLRSHQVRNEISSVRAELGLLDKEIKALEGDRGKMEQMALKIGGGKQADDDDDWDINRTLSHGKISQGQRTLLQEQRGLLLTVNLHNEQARETFLTKCGASATLLRTLQQKAKKSSRPNDPSLALVCLTPDNCRDGGAATTIQNVALMQGATCESAFFISRDKGKSFYWGHLPDRLFRRMKNAGLDPKRHASDLVYVATGAYGCYYAEFRSGERWWGSVSDDMEFDKICADPEWDVHRVAFGPCVTLTDHYGLKNVSPSWVILSRDGRVAWKNLPARLNNLLERRLASEAAPVEVSLGSGGSYFVRFLDGTVDYCLPLAAAKVVQDLEHKGTVITSVAMHCELPNDFIIRHR